MDVFFNQTIAFTVGVVASIAASLIYALFIRRAESRFSFKQILEFVLDLVNLIENDEFRPDLIVAVDRNSAIAGGMIAGHLGLRTIVTAATENERLEDGSRTIRVVEGFLPHWDFFSGKKVLLFICFNDSGSSLDAVYHHLANCECPPAEIRTAALFTSASPKMVPRYFVKKVGVNLKTPVNKLMPKMPWITRSWKHVFAKERYGDQK